MIAAYGGDEAVHDIGLVESAIAQPHASFGGNYLHEDVASMAAAYLFHLAKNHGFADGNKRVGTAAAMIFLEMNDVQITAFTNEEIEKLTLDVVTDVIGKEQAAEMIRQRVLT